MRTEGTAAHRRSDTRRIPTHEGKVFRLRGTVPHRLPAKMQWQRVRGGHGYGTPDHGDGFAAELHRLPFSFALYRDKYSTEEKVCQ